MFTKELCKFIINTNFEDIPQDVLAVARHAILDYLGVTMSGSQEPSGQMMIEMVKESQSPPEATVIGGHFKASCEMAALANGTSAHTQDYDDCLDFPSAGLAHPTAGTFSGLLTIGEKNHLSGKDLITAYCLGVEGFGKTGLFMVKSGGAGSRAWEWTGTLGVIGGTIGLAKMFKLDETQMKNALGVAASMSCGTMRNFGSFAGHVHGGNAARNAIEAVNLAMKGYDATGTEILEGTLYNSLADFPDILPTLEEQQEKVDALGNPWNLVNPSLMFKYYPVAHISHFGVYAGQLLRKNNPIDWRQIEEIEFRSPFGYGTHASPPIPTTGVQGRFSLGYCMCRSLIHGEIEFGFFTDEAVKDKDTIDLMNKIKWATIERADVVGPFGYQELVVKMKDGTTYSQKVEHPKGEPQNPQSPEELIEKFKKCAAYANYAEPTVNKIIDMVADFENISDINELTELLA